MIHAGKCSSCNIITLFILSCASVSQQAYCQSATDNQRETQPVGSNGKIVAKPFENSAYPKPEPASSSTPAADTADNTIVVTGTNIRGGPSVGSRLDVFTGQDINNAGYATLNQFMQTYAQNFSGGNSEDTFDRQSQGNFTKGAGINLRGLGNNSTLVLINGRRLPAAGLDTSFADVSNIPASAIERVEILTDGGSAIYGTDAIAGVVNILLRRDYEGAETRARFGTVTKGGLQEYQLAQTSGTHWSGGHGLIVYEYYRREPLDRTDRSYMGNADLRRWGGTDRRTAFSNPGNILDPVTGAPAYAVPAGQDGTALTPSDLLAGQVNRLNQWAYGTALSLQDKHSVFGYVEQDFADSVKIGLEGRFVRRKFESKVPVGSSTLVVPASNPFFVDPFGNSDFVLVQYNLTPDLGPGTTGGKVKSYNLTASADIDLFHDLQARAYASRSKETSNDRSDLVDWSALNALLAHPDPNVAFNPFGDRANKNKRSLESIWAWTSSKTHSKTDVLNVVVDGTLFDIGSEGVKFAIGGDYQNIDFDVLQKSSTQPPRQGDVHRTVKALFGELYIPIVAREKEKILDLSAALRYDKYSDFGGTWNPKIGLRWTPDPVISFRATWGTSFRAPNLANMSEQRNYYSMYDTPDPRNPGESITILYKAGGNARLGEETSENWTIGATLTVPENRSLTVSVDYFNISFENRVRLLDDPILVLQDPGIYGEFGIVSPTASDVRDFCSADYQFVGANPSICTGLESVDILADLRYQNFAKTSVDGLDVQADYVLELPAGSQLTLGANISYLFNLKEAVADTAPKEELVDTFGYPTDLRIRGSVGWSNKTGLNFLVFVNYADRYKDKTNAPFLKIDDYLTFDLTISKTFSEEDISSVLSGTTITFNAINIFASNPPFANDRGAAYDASNADPLGRFAAITVTKKW